MNTPAFLNFDPVAHEYDATRYLRPEMQQVIAAHIQEAAQLQSGQILLDAGVGTGRFALPLAEREVPVVGVDISTQMLAALCQKRTSIPAPLPLRVLRGDLRHLPFPSDTFGAALIVHILHLIADWQAVLREVQRVLAPGGVLLLGQESGRHDSYNNVYYTLARERGLLNQPPGTRNREIIHEFLQSQGATITEREPLQWQQAWRLTEVMDMLRRRTWSNLWNVPDADHATLLAETEAALLETYGSLDTIVEMESAFTLRVVRW